MLPTAQTDKGREKDRHGIFEGADKVKGTEGRVSVGNRMMFFSLLGFGERLLASKLANPRPLRVWQRNKDGLGDSVRWQAHPLLQVDMPKGNRAVSVEYGTVVVRHMGFMGY